MLLGPMSTSFIIKMRGVPYEAGQKEIFEVKFIPIEHFPEWRDCLFQFFRPVVPIQLDQDASGRGRPPVWYAEFGSREEATEAMT